MAEGAHATPAQVIVFAILTVVFFVVGYLATYNPFFLAILLAGPILGQLVAWAVDWLFLKLWRIWRRAAPDFAEPISTAKASNRLWVTWLGAAACGALLGLIRGGVA